MTKSNAWAMLHVFQDFAKKFKKVSFLKLIKTSSLILARAHPRPKGSNMVTQS